jgi:hypothetical protein
LFIRHRLFIGLLFITFDHLVESVEIIMQLKPITY